MSYPCTIGGAVPISTIANGATSCWPLHHHQQQQQTQVFEKYGERRARWSYVPLHFVCDEHGYGTNTMHNGALGCDDYGWKTTVKSSPSTFRSRPWEKISSMRRTQSLMGQTHLVRLSTGVRLILRLRETRSGPIFSQTKLYTWT